VTTPAPDVTLTIVSFNTADLLRHCLASNRRDRSRAQRPDQSVVDNASSDGSADMVAREFPWVELIRNPTNRYFAPAHNQAFPHARGRYVGILNPDTRLFPDTLHKMVSFMDAHPDAGISTCQYTREDGTPLKAEAHNYWRFHSLWYGTLCRNTPASASTGPSAAPPRSPFALTETSSKPTSSRGRSCSCARRRST
jgi:GT2 family glycosyltransferase